MQGCPCNRFGCWRFHGKILPDGFWRCSSQETSYGYEKLYRMTTWKQIPARFGDLTGCRSQCCFRTLYLQPTATTAIKVTTPGVVTQRCCKLWGRIQTAHKVGRLWRRVAGEEQNEVNQASEAAAYWRGSRVRQREELNLPTPQIDIGSDGSMSIEYHGYDLVQDCLEYYLDKGLEAKNQQRVYANERDSLKDRQSSLERRPRPNAVMVYLLMVSWPSQMREQIVGPLFVEVMLGFRIDLPKSWFLSANPGRSGGLITLDVPMTATVRELKSMLLERHPCQDPIERKVLYVELLHNSSIIDETEALDSATFLSAEPLVTVVYRRNEVEATTKHDIYAHREEYFGVKIPSNETNISKAAFKCLRQLVFLIIPESVTHIGGGAFQGCTSLASIALGRSVTHIGGGAFRNCTSLASITLGDSVTHIGHAAFDGCTSLVNITFGESVTHIGDWAFQRCTSLVNITFGESVTHIGVGAFSCCTSLASITLGRSVTHIAHAAFDGCTSLVNITFGESVTHIGDFAFHGCTLLLSITLPESLEHMLRGVFRDSSVTIITIPARKGRKRVRNE
eukprot:symbB.v1.2.004267.t1/scaffold222.1/size270942/9